MTSRGVNFSLFSRTATGVELLFFDREDDANRHALLGSIPFRIERITIGTCACRDVRPGQIYGYRVEGPSSPGTRAAIRFD